MHSAPRAGGWPQQPATRGERTRWCSRCASWRGAGVPVRVAAYAREVDAARTSTARRKCSQKVHALSSLLSPLSLTYHEVIMFSHTLRHITSETPRGEHLGKLYQHMKFLNEFKQSCIVSNCAGDVWFVRYHPVINSYCCCTQRSFSIMLWSSSSFDESG